MRLDQNFDVAPTATQLLRCSAYVGRGGETEKLELFTYNAEPRNKVVHARKFRDLTHGSP
jgi:hypothetical protein